MSVDACCPAVIGTWLCVVGCAVLIVCCGAVAAAVDVLLIRVAVAVALVCVMCLVRVCVCCLVRRSVVALVGLS